MYNSIDGGKKCNVVLFENYFDYILKRWVMLVWSYYLGFNKVVKFIIGWLIMKIKYKVDEIMFSEKRYMMKCFLLILK